MNEEKPIDEMARILAQTYRYPCEETCEECKPKDVWCLAQEAAKNLQKAGFGASAVEARWIERKVRMWAKGGKPYFRYEQECSHCGCINKSKKRWSSKFCFECGAKMRKED
jgi:hypothetical protein